MRHLASLLIAIASAAASAADAPAPAPEKLDDAALDKRIEAIVTELRGKGLQQGEKIDPATIKDQMDAIQQAVAAAASPKGDSATQARLLRAQLLQMEGDIDAAATAFGAVIADGVSADATAAAYGMLGSAYQEAGKGDELAKLADQAAAAKQPDELVQHLRGMVKAAGIQPGKPFPDFAFTDIAGAERKLADYRGKVLLLDFWATWCPPCVAEMPNVKAAYEAYHAQGFEVLGVSLDKDRAKLDKFLADKAIPWPQQFDGQGWSNAVAMSYGIQSIPAPFLIGPDGDLIAKDLRGEDLKAAIEKALPTK